MLYQGIELTLEEKIKQHKRLTYDILDGMVDWVRVIDKDRTIIFANKSMQEYLGQSLVGSNCYLVFGKACPCVRCIGDTTFCMDEDAEKEEMIGDRVYSIKSSPVRDLNGSTYAIVEVFRDVTRERRLEAEVINKNRKMSKDIEFAKKIQESILPDKGLHGNGVIHVDYLYKPSEMLSGDIFDVRKIDDEHIGVYISDVVGHGVTASIMTMFIRQTMERVMKETISTSETISKLHKSFLDLKLGDENYFTIFYAVINIKKKVITYSNGGHNSIPMIIKELNNGKRDICFLESSGYPITYLFESVSYDEHKVNIANGDKIIFFTDGIIECKNMHGELFGTDRLVKVLKESSENLLQNIENSLDDFHYEGVEDDFAILKLEILE